MIITGSQAPAGVRRPEQVAISVWRALFLREATLRLSSGSFWILAEPLAHVAFLMLMFSLLRQGSIGGVDFALFLGVGVMGFGMFKGAAQRPVGAIDANRALFNYRQVKPVDTVLLRALLEGVLQAAVLVVIFSGCAFIGLDVLPGDPLMLMLAVGALWLLGTGLGLVLSVGAGLFPVVQRLSELMFQPLYFLSGVFFRPDMAPPAVREWLLLNPVVNGIEVMRGATFDAYHAHPDVSLGYVLGWALVFLFLGLALHVRHARRLASL